MYDAVLASMASVPLLSFLVTSQSAPTPPAFSPHFSTFFSRSILSAKLLLLAPTLSHHLANFESPYFAISLLRAPFTMSAGLFQTLEPLTLVVTLVTALPTFEFLSASPALAIMPFSAWNTPLTSLPLTPPKPSLRTILLTKFFTLPLIFAVMLPITAFARLISPLRMPLLLPSMPFMNFGPNCIARLIRPPAASLASDTSRSAAAAFSSGVAPDAMSWASLTPLRPVSTADSTNETASQIRPTTLRMRAMPETAAPIGGKIMPSRPMTVRTRPSLPQMLPTRPVTDLITDRTFMMVPSAPSAFL